ncbi:hypothetical protein [Pedobacter boryungensis]|uniref:O-antigen ligase domain-containing protein n=1 Tax=Pedobacter boryungensis TaxID=869962 RepID=A0ABX2DFL9_9SPHI|nr:hypothetical protein [Pedobacter boryungensis]NQX32755.1 hypothetical protein [Pedobacter boryungensis]
MINTLKRIEFLTILKLLFVPILFELVIGGGGHFMELGPLTARMLFFIFAIFLSLSYLAYKKRIKKDIIYIILSFTLILFIGTLVGYVNNGTWAAIIEDLKTMIFFYILLFFSLTIKSIGDIEKVKFIIKSGSLILGIIFVVVILLLLMGRINFISFYAKQNQIGEIMFRNDTLFFYKGFLYLCVGFFFFLLSKGFYNKIGAFFLLLTIILTLTRGFMLFTFLILLYYIFFINKKAIYKWIILILGSLTLVIVVPMLLNVLGDKKGSDGMRYLQINQVIDAINPVSLMVGHGLGIGVESRPVHMELSFLEIFHKQGLIGISFWIGIFSYIFFMYYQIKNEEYKKLALPFLLSVIFIILQSATNPYMNNPIGLTMILITIVIFSKLLELQKTDL